MAGCGLVGGGVRVACVIEGYLLHTTWEHSFNQSRLPGALKSATDLTPSPISPHPCEPHRSHLGPNRPPGHCDRSTLLRSTSVTCARPLPHLRSRPTNQRLGSRSMGKYHAPCVRQCVWRGMQHRMPAPVTLKLGHRSPAAWVGSRLDRSLLLAIARKTQFPTIDPSAVRLTTIASSIIHIIQRQDPMPISAQLARGLAPAGRRLLAAAPMHQQRGGLLSVVARRLASASAAAVSQQRVGGLDGWLDGRVRMRVRDGGEGGGGIEWSGCCVVCKVMCRVLARAY